MFVFEPAFPGHTPGMSSEEFKKRLEKWNSEFWNGPEEVRYKYMKEAKKRRYDMWLSEVTKVAAEYGVSMETLEILFDTSLSENGTYCAVVSEDESETTGDRT